MEGTASEPRVRRQRIIERPRLLRLLDESPARVKMLVAPAGYGKTTLARQWLAGNPGPVLWITATPAAADVAVLFRELCRGLGRVAPGRDDRLRERLAVTADPEAEWEVLVEILLEDLESLDSEPYLVLDDYHTLTESAAAQSIVSQVVAAPACTTLIVGRSRPSWVSARQILYGEVLELGQNALAMTDDEASSAFAENARIAPGLVHLAQGWPAVLALAALAPDASFPEVGDALPETLHAFFAEELYQCLDVEVQRGLTRIALAEVNDVETAREFFDDTEKGLEQAAAVGWISDAHSDTIDLHPLLRAFLRRKLERDEPEEFRAACESTARLLIEQGGWDEAGRLIVDQKLYPLLVQLLEVSLESLLLHGRLATVRDWSQLCKQNGLDAPIVRLATAELAFRSGQFFEAEVLAASISELQACDRLRFKALMLAGRTAHLGSREVQSLEYFRAARAAAHTSDEHEIAALGELTAAIELELPEADDLFNELAHGERKTPEQRVTLVAKGLSLDTRSGRPPRLNEARREHQLLNSVRDPVARSAFRNIFGYWLAQSGALREARALVAEQRRDVAEYRLTFAIAYTDFTEAVIEVVEGDFEGADVTIDRLEDAGRESGDWFLVANAIGLRARAMLGRGALDDAFTCTLHELGTVTTSMTAEIVATRALALACARRTRDALAAADEAGRASGDNESVVLVSSTRAVAAINDGTPEAFAASRDALLVCRRLNTIEGFVAALRGCPELGGLLMDVAATRNELLPILALSNELARYEKSGGDKASSAVGTWHDLSKREKEVLQHVARGMTNPEIAAALFITEATVKVHVHHILEKLGVRSRTAAALRVPPDVRATQPAPGVGSQGDPG